MENEEKSTEFGRYLRTHRRSKGISLEEVSEKTKITLAILRQLEDEALDKLPAPAFVKGFIQAYAGVVGVDVAEALKRYEEKLMLLGGKDRLQPLKLETERRHTWPPIAWGALGLGCLVIGVALIFLFQYFKKPEDLPPGRTALQVESSQKSEAEEKQPVSEVPTQTSEEMTRQGEAAPGADEPPATKEESPSDVSPEAALEQKAVVTDPMEASQPPSAPDARKAEEAPQERAAPTDAQPEEEMVLEISAIERTWLRVTIDESQIKEVTIAPQDKITLKARKQFDLFVGNAGGIEATLNGRPVDIPGGSGQVARLKLP